MSHLSHPSNQQPRPGTTVDDDYLKYPTVSEYIQQKRCNYYKALFGQPTTKDEPTDCQKITEQDEPEIGDGIESINKERTRIKLIHNGLSRSYLKSMTGG